MIIYRKRQSSMKTIYSIIRNQDQEFFDGDLIFYFRLLFFHSNNSNHPYHNIRHMLHVMWECYDGAVYHGLDRRQFRNILISAIGHDLNHSRRTGGDDGKEIETALRTLANNILAFDKEYFDEIEVNIRATQYPYVIPEDQLKQSQRIIRDADMSQTFSPVWLQQTIFGLAEESGKRPLELLEGQVPFLNSLKFFSEWGRSKFTPQIEAKKKEVEEYLLILKA